MPHDFQSEAAAKPPADSGETGPKAPWIEACVDLVSARLALFQCEAKQAAARSIAKIVLLIAGLLALAVTWLLLMAALIGIIASHTPLAWYWTSLCIAGIHLAAALALLRAAKVPGASSFEQTRAEFTKDREWFQSLQHPKSRP